jgi:RNA polymerase sigma-70 factor (ECF subfamily)
VNEVVIRVADDAEPRTSESDFTAMCQREYPRLVGLLVLAVGDRSQAEDIAQEALARAWSRWARVSTLDRPDQWVRRVAMNLSTSWWRRQQVAGRRAAALPPDPALIDDPPVTDDDLVRQVRALPQRQRMAIACRYFADMSVADTAAAMGCREGTVKALTSQAISALRKVAVFDEEHDGA